MIFMKKYAIWRTRWGMRTMIEGWFSLDGEPVLFDSESRASEYLRRLIQKNYDFNTEFEVRVYRKSA